MADLPDELGVSDAVPVAHRVSHVWRGRRDGADVAVRRTPWFRKLDEVRYEVEVLRALHASGAPVVVPIEAPVQATDGVWTVFEWVDGVEEARPVADPARYGALLVELHGVALSMPQRPLWCRVDEFFTFPRRDGSTFEEVADAFAEVEPRLVRFAREVHERLRAAEVERLPTQVVHGDFGPHQVLWSADGRAVVLDWDFCHLDLRAADVAIGASLARPTAARAAAYLDAYGALEPEERAVLDDLRRAFHLNNLATQVCVLWQHGLDISGPLAAITERLDREQWWGPTLLAARRSLPRDVATDLDVANELADRAAIVASHWFEARIGAVTKADGSPVTEADGAVERLLREGLAELRPDDAVLGEELGVSGSGDRTWIIDPIDGTNFFADGSPYWRIQLALEADGDLVVAVVDSPALGLRWWATRGGGAFERDADGVVRRLAVSSTAALPDAVVTYYPHAVIDRLPAAVRLQAWDRFTLPELVRGELEAFYVECCEVWDHAPWVLLVEEAGGRFTDLAGGRSPAERGGLYSNAAVHDALLGAITRP